MAETALDKSLSGDDVVYDYIAAIESVAKNYTGDESATEALQWAATEVFARAWEGPISNTGGASDQLTELITGRPEKRAT